MFSKYGNYEVSEILAALRLLRDSNFLARMDPSSEEAQLATSIVNELSEGLNRRGLGVFASQLALEAVEMGTWKLHCKQGKLIWDDTMYRVFGRSPQDYPGAAEAWQASLEPTEMEAVMEQAERIIREGGEFDMQYGIVTSAGEHRRIHARGRVAYDEDGTPACFYGIAYDRTREFLLEKEREELNQKLKAALVTAKESANRQRKLFNEFPGGVSLIDKEARFLAVNPAYCRMLGYEQNELLQMKVVDVLGENLREVWPGILRDLLSIPGPIPPLMREFVHKSGRPVWARIHTCVSVDEEGQPRLLSMVEDVTEQHRQNGERAQLLNEKEIIFRSAQFCIFTTDLRGVITGFSREAERVSGRPGTSVVGAPLLPFEFDSLEMKKLASELADEFRAEVPIGFECLVFRARSGVPEERLWNLQTPAGPLALLLSVTGLYDAEGALYGFMGIGRDLSAEMKARAEAEAARVKTINQSKLAALGEMAGGVAHEINNPLAIIQLSAQQLSDQLLKPAPDAERLDKISKTIARTTERIAKIVQGLRSFSRDGGSDPFVAVSLEEVLAETVGFCQEKLRHRGIELKISGVHTGQMFSGRAVQISQVLLNLLNNASDALEQADEKWIHVSASETSVGLEIRVTDSGPGIPDAVCERMFQPFFTTKEIGKGTGMGLSISQSLVREHGGELFLDPEVTATTFVIRLPKLRAAA